MDESSEEVKFAADRMLGRLVKWLRVIGQDVIYGPHLTGFGLIRAARREHRVILTRDRGLKKKQPPEFIFIESDRYADQLLLVIDVCRLKPLNKLFTRCLVCNAPLQPKAKDLVQTLVPAYVFSTQERFFWCPECRRAYWPATHHERILQQLMKLGVC